MNERFFFQQHPKLTILVVSITSIVLILLVLEAAFRIIYYVKDPEVIMDDPELGWVLNVKNKKVKIRFNRCGERVVLKPPAHALILKYPRYSNPKRVLFLGDSFTQAHEVSTGSAYYDVFEELVKDEYSVYAVGVGGFGNLQEYMSLKRVWNIVRPDVVVWQLSRNDPSDNVFEIDDSSLWNNQRPRPYLNLEDNAILIKNPGFWLFDLSRGFKYVFGRSLSLDVKYNLGVLAWLNSRLALEEDVLKVKLEEGFDVLDMVLKMAGQLSSKMQLVGFSTDEGYDSRFKEIFERNGAVYFSGFSSKVASIEGTNCLPLDGHWNHKGNRVAGLEMFERFREHGLLKD